MKMHFSVDVRYKVEGCKNDAARRKEQRHRLKELGMPTRYFTFVYRDELGKEAAKATAEIFRDEWMQKSGIELSVLEGCFA